MGSEGYTCMCLPGGGVALDYIMLLIEFDIFLINLYYTIVFNGLTPALRIVFFKQTKKVIYDLDIHHQFFVSGLKQKSVIRLTNEF